MSTDLRLLDTPKRISLQSQSTQIRAALKDFERTFAENNDGRKPSKDDIRADAVVAAKYKDYNKIRDVLSGKLDYAVLIAAPKSPTKKQKHERTDSGVSWSPRRKSYDATPRKPTRFSDSEVGWPNAISSASPKPVLLHAIGPTPQRDGKVLGLFDLLSNSAHSSRDTPSGRKRKLDALIEESPRKNEKTAVAQTPSGKRVRAAGDILDHLTGTPETSRRKHSRTPISEGRKFMLSQFFATPSTARFSNVNPNLTKERTPLRDKVLGITPVNRNQTTQPAPDVTPAYLRRSTSFKDRLLSASRNPENNSMTTAVSSTAIGPPTLKHLRSVQRSFDDLHSIFSDIEEEAEAEEEYEDELDALRELEDGQINVLVRDSQRQRVSKSADTANGDENNTQPLQRVWKKKGQKRTTRKTVMRPAQGPLPKAPRFVAADNHSEDEGEISQVEETQLNERPSRTSTKASDGLLEDEYDFDQDLSDTGSEQAAKSKSKKVVKVKEAQIKDKSKKAATINPNAVSHMNFRTLKIKNKNSKAKGRGKFGRGRR